MKNKFTWFVIVFIFGLFVGGIFAWTSVLCCQKCCGNPKILPPPKPKYDKIHKTKANEFFKCYLNSKDTLSVHPFIAFTISADQLAAMNDILEHNSRVDGFRIYMGVDTTNKRRLPVRMIVGITESDECDVVFATTDVRSGPCPNLCDVASDITKK